MAKVSIAVRVRPGASRTKVGGYWGEDCQLVVAVNAPPVDGAANEAVIDSVAAAFGLRKRQVSLVQGQTSRSKVLELEVDDDEVDAVTARLAELRKA